MTILEGEFAMMMILSFASAAHPKIEMRLERLRSRWGLVFFWKEIQDTLHRGEKHARGASAYLINAIGKDRTGIVYRISELLVRFGLNITDLNSRILGHGRHTVYAMMLEADIPARFDLKSLKHALKQLSRKLKIEIHLKPVEHFGL